MTRLRPVLLTALLGLAGAGLVLYAWGLPPFGTPAPMTDNAYVRGKITTLAPQLSGYVAEVAVSDYQPVKAGQVIARLEDTIWKQRLASAEAGLAVAVAAHQMALQNLASAEAISRADALRLEAAKLAAETAATDAARREELNTRGVLSEATRDQARLAQLKAESQLAELEASLVAQTEKIAAARSQGELARQQITQAEAAVELARIDLAHTEITAPEEGTLGQVSVRAGQFVTAGTALVSHVGPQIWVIANFTENAFERLEPGQKVHMAVDALGHRQVEGTIASVSPAAASEFSLMAGSNATGNFTRIVQRIPVRIEITEGQAEASRLRPGMSVVVTAE